MPEQQTRAEAKASITVSLCTEFARILGNGGLHRIAPSARLLAEGRPRLRERMGIGYVAVDPSRVLSANTRAIMLQAWSPISFRLPSLGSSGTVAG